MRIRIHATRAAVVTFIAAAATQMAALTLPASAGEAALPNGKKAITLISAGGDKLRIGDVTFVADGSGRKFNVSLDAPEFGEEFLSMRPFSCLKGAKETWCHLAYPYDLEHRIAAGNLVDLEYALLFLFKTPASYGINTWNGLYFKLALDGDGAIAGTIQDIDLGPLGSPPADPAARPIQQTDLFPAQPEAHRFARIEIR